MFGLSGEHLGALILLFIVFLICRHIVCWYWKINRGIELLQDIRHELVKLNGGRPAQDPKTGPSLPSDVNPKYL